MSKQIPQKSRLGRGLSSLMNMSQPVMVELPAPGTPAAPATAEIIAPLPLGVSVLEVSPDRIVPNPHQPRREFDEPSLKALAESIRTTGLIQPVVARATNEGTYELIAGERRWRASKLAGLAALPVIVRNVDPVMQAQMALVENIQRQDLNPVDRAMAYKALLDNLGLTQVELADRLGEDRTVISHYLRLIDLAPAVQSMIVGGQLSMSHARLLAGVSDPVEQTRLARLVVSQELNIRNLERLINTPAVPASTPQAALSSSAHIVDLERNLSRNLGMRVQVKVAPGKKRGRLILHYASLDQFDDLMSKLGVSGE